MKKALGSCVLLLAVTVTGSAKDTFGGIVEEMIKLSGSVAEVLSTVKDKETAQKATPKVKEFGKTLKALKDRADKLGKPSAEDLKLLQGPLGEKLKAAVVKLVAETNRLANVEGGPELSRELDVVSAPKPVGRIILKKEGKLANTDPKDKKLKDSHHKVEELTLTPGSTYSIDLQSKAFDSYLRLQDSAGKELANDDDSGGGLNARIVFAPTKQDTYRIIITTFEGGQTGDYVLIVRHIEDKKGEEKKEESKK